MIQIRRLMYCTRCAKCWEPKSPPWVEKVLRPVLTFVALLIGIPMLIAFLAMFIDTLYSWAIGGPIGVAMLIVFLWNIFRQRT